MEAGVLPSSSTASRTAIAAEGSPWANDRSLPHPMTEEWFMPNRRDFLVGSANLVGAIALGDAVLADEPGVGVSARARQFVKTDEETVRPLEKSAALAWWNANISGKDEDFAAKEKAQNKLDAALSDRQRFAELKAIKGGRVDEPVLARQVEVLYLAYLEKQVDPSLLQKMTAKANAIEKAFNVYRARVDGKEVSDSEVRKVLKNSHESTRRQAVWEASKAVGPVVEADLKSLVRLRNEAARSLGFRDFHAMQLSLNEQDQGQVVKL